MGFDKIIKPEFEKVYDFVEVREYAEEKSKKVCEYVKYIQSIGGEYIFVSDIDEFPCITKKKQKLVDIFDGIDDNRVIIVKKEIESWYLAGLDANKCRKFKMKHFNDTENIRKEDFKQQVPMRCNEVMYMIEILEEYCPYTAKEQNNSFKYFVNKYNIHN